MDALKNLYTYTRKYKYELIAGIIALILTDALGLLPPWLIKLAIDYIDKSFVQPPESPFVKGELKGVVPLIKYSVLIITAVGLQAVFRYYWRKHLFGISRKVEYDLRNDYFKHLQRLHWGFFQHTKTGDIMSRATNDLQAVREFLGIGSVIIVDTAVIMTTCLILMIFISPKLTGISLLPMALVSIIVLKFSKEIRQRFESVQKQLSEISSMVHENIAGIRVIQAYVQEENELNRFKKLNEQLINKNLELTKISGAFFPLMVFTTGLATALVLWIGGREVIRGQLTLGSYVAFNGYLAMLTWPMAAIGFMINLSQRGIASMRRIEEIMNVKEEIYDGTTSPIPIFYPTQPPLTKGRSVPFQFVEWWYDQPQFVVGWCYSIKKALDQFDPKIRDTVPVLFSAHGLPLSFITERKDPYPKQIQECAGSIMSYFGGNNPAYISYQSKVGPMEWLKPATIEFVPKLALEGVQNLVIAPISFITDHLETLYEIDHEIIPAGLKNGMEKIVRCEALVHTPYLLKTLEDLALKRIRTFLI